MFYVRTNYGDGESIESYIDCLGKLHAITVDVDLLQLHTLMAGD